MSTQMFVIEIGWRQFAVPIEKIDSVLKTLLNLKEVAVNASYIGFHHISEAKPVVSECKLAAVTETDPNPRQPKAEIEEE